MRAIINVEITCECGGLMQPHQDKYVRCHKIKCKHRHINYLAPTVDLETEYTEEKVPPKAPIHLKQEKRRGRVGRPKSKTSQ